MSAKSNKKYSRYNQTLMDRVDHMEVESEYDPYKATKRHNIDNKNLFSEDAYEDAVEVDPDADEGKGIVIAVVVILVIIVAVLAYIILK
jgi:hypothetical protein